MKFLKILILFFPLLSNAQFTQSFDWKKITGNVSGGGSNSVLTIDETNNTISLSFACSFSSISIPNKHVIDIDYPLNLPNMILGNINSSTGVSTYQIVILNNKIYLYSTSNDLISSMNGTLSSSLLSYTPIDNITLSSFGQISQNYIKTTTYNSASGDSGSKNIEILYFDGLGRPIQKIDNALSNSGKDIITSIKYDALGRQTKDFLPYPSTQNNLNYIDITNFESEITNYYQVNYGDNNPYSEKLYESTLLDRVIKISAPGNDWVMGGGKEIKFDYQTNSNSDNVKLFTANATWNSGLGVFDISITQNGNYQANQLFKTITKDENWTTGKNNTTEEYTDKEGKVILKRNFANIVVDGSIVEFEAKHDTYYVYDQHKNLTYVLPPLTEGAYSQVVLDNLCYQYKYDSRNRLVSKKLPGKQWEYIVYDRLDRPVATGPVFSPYGDGSNGWMITQYDVFDRVTQTGWKNSTVTETTRNTNQTLINSGSNPFVLSTNDILTKNFYDNYSFSGAPSSIPTTLPNSSLSIATNLKGMLTGSWVKTLESATSTNAEISYVLYDVRYRPVQTKKTNYYGGYTQVDSNMDWAGKLIYTITKHKRTNTDNELVIKDMFEYTDQDRIEIHKQQIISSPSMPEQLISKNTYDELGQLIIKNVGGEDITGTNSLQTVDYKYNIRGWLKSINDVDFIGTDLFAFKINYNDAETATDLYNGNISETFWKTKSDNIKRKYDYTYDHLNRLLKADYSKEGSTTFNSYLEQLTYDKNGNIQTLLRNGDMDTDGYQFEQIIDDLVYSYNPQNKNLLEKVIDKSIAPQGFNESYDLNSGDSDGIDDITIDYTYDLNGNMLSDTNKGIENIVYNHLNLPIEITFQNGKINYLYNAFGQKVKKTVTEGSTITTTDYLNGFQYKNDVLQFFPHAEGYVNATQSKTAFTFNYVFNYTDHLGNIRLSYSKDPVTSVLKIIEENHYYPFGLKHSGYNSDKMMYSRENSVLKIRPVPPSFITSYSKKFNGQSWETDLGLNITAMDYRQYDNTLGRFNSMDKLAELAPGISPYRFAFNNPVFWGDPTGLIEQSVVMDIFKRSSHGQTWYNNGQDGFETSNRGYVSYTSEDTSWNSSPGNSVRMPAVTVIGNKKTRKYSEEVILGAANQIISDYLSWSDGEDDVSSHFDPWTALKIGVSTQGFQLGSRGYIKSNRFGWFNAKGKWNSSNTLIKQANGKFVTGVQGKRISKTVAGNFSKTLKAGSTKWGYASAVLTTLEAGSDGKLTAGEGAKIAISILSTMGPVGWIYSGLDLTVSLFNNGVGVTDMIGNAIDERTGGASVNINPFD